MRGRGYDGESAIAIGLALTITGCATVPTGKPILTKRAFHRIARQCGVTPTEFKTARSGLPYVRFLYRDAAQESDVRPPPAWNASGAALKAIATNIMVQTPTRPSPTPDYSRNPSRSPAPTSGAPLLTPALPWTPSDRRCDRAVSSPAPISCRSATWSLTREA